MSLKTIHIFLISASIALCTYFGIWLLKNATRPAAAASFVVAGALTLYLSWFIMKLKKRGL